MEIEIYIPTSEKYSRVREVETLEQAAWMVKNNIYISGYLWEGKHSNELEYIKHSIMEVRASKDGEGVIVFCCENDGAYAKVLN